MQRKCIQCGTYFEAARSATSCSAKCRMRKSRGSAPAAILPDDLVDGISSSKRIGVFKAVSNELERAGKVETSLGQAALHLALLLENCQADTVSGVASLSKELRSVMAQALGGSAAAVDDLDELRGRRDRKRTASG